MNVHMHVFYTWLLAHALHSFLWCLGVWAVYGDNAFSMELFLYFIPVSVIASLPALFISMGILSLFKKAALPVIIKAALWLAALLLVVVVNFLLLLFCLGLGSDALSVFHFVLPAMVAVFLAFFFRLQQLASFLTLNTINNENNLV